MIDEYALNIYTDGSSLSRPRRGGMGARFVIVDAQGNEVRHDEQFVGHKEATNNQMELLACVKALQDIPPGFMSDEIQRIIIYTDSMYVRDNKNNAIFSWPTQGWRNRDGKAIENVDLWKALVKKIKNAPRSVVIKWVKGHAKNEHNNAADKLARASAEDHLNEPLFVQSVRRKKTTQSVSYGSVLMEGQELDIRVITDKWMRHQKIWRYKYEVLECDSPYVGSVDIIDSEHQLRAHHSYRVVVGENPRNPMILDVLFEIEEETD